MSTVTTVLFDLDETLCVQPTPSADRLDAAFDRAGVEPFCTAEEYLRLFHEHGGCASDVRRRERCFETLAREAGLDDGVGLRVADAYEALTDYTAVEFLPGAEAVLDDFAERYRLGLVTNGGPDTQSAKVDALGLRERFETVVLAGWHTDPKPAAEPFERAMTDMDVTPEGTVYVGNSPTSDVAGAANAGIRSVWIPYGDDDPGSHAPDYTLDGVRGLLDEPWSG